MPNPFPVGAAAGPPTHEENNNGAKLNMGAVKKTYRGRQIKRMKQVPGGKIKLIFLSEQGEAGEQIIVSQDEWARHGTSDHVPDRKVNQQ